MIPIQAGRAVQCPAGPVMVRHPARCVPVDYQEARP
ncbi:hypothetical protein BCO71171_04297 [Burkholderia contaminans]|uniref:Uncharacterized protein n=1 Tax=Burkholderia contaminans TaxID=488447 RepID=A0A6P2ZXF2_9BURK|nr:hypothetical protein BCO71171_04297 [Burkholderia contaminans]